MYSAMKWSNHKNAQYTQLRIRVMCNSTMHVCNARLADLDQEELERQEALLIVQSL